MSGEKIMLMILNYTNSQNDLKQEETSIDNDHVHIYICNNIF